MRKTALAALAVASALALSGCASQDVAPRASELPVLNVTDKPYVADLDEGWAYTPATEDEEVRTQVSVPAEDEEVRTQVSVPAEEPEPDPATYADPSSDWYGEVNGHPTRYEFSTMGVLRDGRFTYCWYSSNDMPHWRMSEWHTDSEGYWRTEDGYLVVASSDYPEGTELVTDMFGRMRVLDTGCAHGVIDVYVSW